ncbi:ROK family protein [Streptomyces sp. BI20]|uniref:ROK family transcriptional regulator n=1 Tax=Streptomyces sp. BI20 TaxID=3403460 RepID=UPI003C764BB8
MNRGTGANLPSVRHHNGALLLDLLRAAGPGGLGRAELAERSGLTPQAVSKICARLRADGLVDDAGRAASTGGKPRTLLRLVPHGGHAIGVHVDRDGTHAVLVDLTGRVLAEARTPVGLADGACEDPAHDRPHPPADDPARDGDAARTHGTSGPPAGDPGRPGPHGAHARHVGVRAACGLVDAVTGLVRGLLPAGSPPVPVGVALPGPLDARTGVLGPITAAPAWAGVPLRALLAERLAAEGLTPPDGVVLDKDTNAVVVGALRALPDPAGDVVCLHLGTGLGAGLHLGGTLHRGARSAAGEFGHQVLDPAGPRCACGARGCVEALCLAAAARGDLPAAARALGEAAANLVALLDVDRLLLGGGTVDAAPEVFLTGVRAALAARSHPTPYGPSAPAGSSVTVSRTPVGPAAGAAELALAPLFGRRP